MTTSVLVQVMGGTLVEHLDHEPSQAELDGIKQSYLGLGADVVSVRAVAGIRIPPYRNYSEPLPEDRWR